MKPEYHVVSFSGGKDSTAMLLHLIELKHPIDEIIYCDTGKEFPAMERHIEKIRHVADEAGIRFTTLRAEHSFDYYMFEKPVQNKSGTTRKGYDWAGAKNRWCTGMLKEYVINKYLRHLRNQYAVLQYVGIAADETKRLERKNNKEEGRKHPLVDWGWTEADCLNYCQNRGYDWEGLYLHHKRASCWCCPLQTLEQLRATRTHYPELWEKLRAMDHRARLKIKPDYSVDDLDVLFDLKDEYEAAGKSTKTRAFYTEYRRRKDANLTI